MYNSQQVERKLLASARLKQLAIAHSVHRLGRIKTGHSVNFDLNQSVFATPSIP